MIGLGKQSKPAFTDIYSPLKLSGNKRRITRSGFAIEKHDGRRSNRCIGDGETPAGGGEGVIFVSWLPVAGFRGWVGSSAASAVVNHSSAIAEFYIVATSVARLPSIIFSTSALSIPATGYMTNSLLSTLHNV